MQQSTASIDVVHAAFVETRGWAQGVGTRRLRRKVRRLSRGPRDYYDPDYARLTAMRHELADRGVPT